MQQVISTITSKGQVTIPATIRRQLGLNSHDKIVFTVDPKSPKFASIQPAQFSNLSSLQGAAGKLQKRVSWRKIKQIARQERMSQKYGR